MKKRFYLVMAMIALSWMGCSQEEDAVNQMQMNGGKTINATIESTTRSTVTDAGVFSWAEGDAISLHSGQKCDFYTYIYSSQNDFYLNGTSNVDFPQVAYYPGNTYHTEDEFYLRDTYGVTSDGIDYSSHEENTYAAMIATPPTEGNTFEFKHLGGVMRFNVKNVPMHTTEFVFTAVGKRISGLFTINVTEGVKTIATEDINGQSSVSIKFAKLQESKDMTFYVPMPVGTYTDYKVSIKVGDDLKSHESTGVTNTIARKTLLLMPTFTYNASTGKLEKGGVSSDNAIDLRDGSAEAEIIGNAEVEVTPGDADATATLNYTPASDGSSEISISDGTNSATSAESEGKVVVSTADNSTVASCEINTPSLTVELSTANGGTATFNEVTALTAEQTLIIGEGVTIKKLVVKGGNVVLKGNVESIESEAATTTVTLGGNLTITNPIAIGNGVTLDLGGYTIKENYDGGNNYGTALNIFGNATIKNGTIEVSNMRPILVDNEAKIDKVSFEKLTIKGNRTGDYGSVLLVGNANVTIDSDVTITASGNYDHAVEAACYYVGDTDAAKIDINGATISLSGSNSKQATVIGAGFGSTINVNSGTIDGSQSLYAVSVFNTGGTINIIDGTIKGVFKKYTPDAGKTLTISISKGIFTDASAFDYLASEAEITLGADMTLSNYITIRDKKVVVNLNGCTITQPAESDAKWKDVFLVRGAGELTINGNGSIIADGANANSSSCVYAEGDSKVTLNGGCYFAPASAVEAYGNAIVTINGGEYSVDVEPAENTPEDSAEYGHKYTLNLKDGNAAQIIVKGGKFYKYDPANSKSENPTANLVADGYVSTLDGDYYVVTAK